jgi:hypothetical protein
MKPGVARARLKNVKTPKHWISFRQTALKILKYTKYSCNLLPCLAKKSRAVGHSAFYQTSSKEIPLRSKCARYMVCEAKKLYQ